MSKHRFVLATLAVLGLVVAACGSDDEATGTEGAEVVLEGTTVRLLAHDSFALTEELLVEFEADTGMTVEILQPGDAVSVVNRAILTKNDPEADVLFGVDNNVLSRALAEDLFQPYEAEGLENVDPSLILDDQHRVTPIDVGDVCLNYDIAWFDDAGLPPPASLDHLIDPAYQGLTVVQNPAASTPGLAFLLATIETYGDDGWLDWWSDLRANDVLVTDGWSEAYFGPFTVGGGGDRPIVVSYASSPPAEVVFGELEAAPTAVLAESCFRQIEFAGVLSGAANPEGARVLIAWLLGADVQADIPLNMFVFPAVTDTPLPEVFVEWAEVPEAPLSMSPDRIDENRDDWVDAWTDTVLR
ncbi:MAG: thiamine ABC transporter substrate-binding protein [Actinomycetia bacterium]|nr:thiamine ABC transporter substrate-binding protein [Actinomycetes bacterium]